MGIFDYFYSSEASLDEEAALKSLKITVGDDPTIEADLRRGGEPGIFNQGGFEHILLRFLRAEKYNMEKAAKRLKEHAVWRASSFPEGQKPEDRIQNELATKKVFVQGCDIHGRGIILLLVARHSKSMRDLEETKRLICYSLDTSIKFHDLQRNPDGKGIGIFDLRGIVMDTLDFGALKAVFDLLAFHYPERLGTLYMFDAPIIFNALWRAVSPFIDADTKKKVIFISGSTGMAELLKVCSPEVLPREFGGNADLIPVDQAVARLQGPTLNGQQNGHQSGA